MRIDVDRDPLRLETELDALYERLAARPRRARLSIVGAPHLSLCSRIADGEYYVYVEDRQQRCLAGCTVFNRLVGIHRRLDRHIRSPHSRFRPAYQRQGLATLVYRQALDAGLCLLSGARQSRSAHALWRSLGRSYALHCVRLQDGRLVGLDGQIDGILFDELDTRLLLCGLGWDLERVAALPATPAGWPDLVAAAR